VYRWSRGQLVHACRRLRGSHNAHYGWGL
jgi:hypothetical protein